MLPHLWGISASEAKLRAQKKLQSGEVLMMEAVRTKSREKMTCRFSDTPYSYEDAVLLSKVWGKTPAEAQAAVVDKYRRGLEMNILLQLEGPRDSAIVMPEVIDGCHVKMLTPVWGKPAAEIEAVAKKRAASKEVAVRRSFARDLDLGRAKLARTVHCEFTDTRFRYEDAARVAKAWGTSVEAAKTKILDKYKWGSENNVPSIR